MSNDYRVVFSDFINKIAEEDKRKKLESIFEYIEKEFPNLDKRIAWNQPMYTDHGTYIIAFSVSKNHISVSPEAKGIEMFKDDISKSGYEYSVMLFRLPYNKEIDYSLLGRIIKYQIEDKKELTTFWRK
ncbi:MAG: iron chaperone [Candidatus Izemoplasmatales bacterium]